MRTLIYDIETATHGDRPDPAKDELRVFGCYSLIDGKYRFLTDREEIEGLVLSHDVLVGFNNISYDNAVLHREFPHIVREYGGGFYFSGKTNIDLMDVVKKRCNIIKTKKGILKDLLMRFSLDYITTTLNLTEGGAKMKDFDYALLKRKDWTAEEWRIITEYTQRDLDLTRKLYDWLEAYFDAFKGFVSEEDVRKKKYLTTSVGAYVYKVFCRQMNLPEEYNDVPEEQGVDYEGGFSSFPAGERFAGNLHVFDIQSAYPHAYMMGNLFSPSMVGWSGGTLFKTVGTYSTVAMGKKEELIRTWFTERLRLKAVKDPKEFTYKTKIVTIYGCSGSPKFKHLYNKTTAADCTSLVRQWIKLIRRRFHEAGYLLVNTDTDSVFVQDPHGDEARLLAVRDAVQNEILSSVPFPQPTFAINHEDRLSDIWFFKGGNTTDYAEDDVVDAQNSRLGFLRKNYIYRTVDGRIVVKNLGMRRKNTSELARKVFWDVLVPLINEKRIVKFPREFVQREVDGLLKQDPMLVAVRYAVGEPSSYKAEGSLHKQIAERYGAGVHFLIPNRSVGVGKAKKYCTVDEFKKHNLTVNDIDVGNAWGELAYFIQDRKGWGEYG